MVKESTESVTAAPNITKENMATAIKAYKRELEDKQNVSLSVCDIMKENTSEIVKKMESKVPSYVQLYSDIYTKYLHIMDNLVSTCYISEKKFFDKIGMDEAALGIFEAYWKVAKQMSLFQIDMAETMAKNYVQHRLSVLDSYDKTLNLAMINYTRLLSQFNFFKR